MDMQPVLHICYAGFLSTVCQGLKENIHDWKTKQTGSGRGFHKADTFQVRQNLFSPHSLIVLKYLWKTLYIYCLLYTSDAADE